MIYDRIVKIKSNLISFGNQKIKDQKQLILTFKKLNNITIINLNIHLLQFLPFLFVLSETLLKQKYTIPLTF